MKSLTIRRTRKEEGEKEENRLEGNRTPASYFEDNGTNHYATNLISKKGIEPMTTSLSMKGSTAELRA